MNRMKQDLLLSAAFAAVLLTMTAPPSIAAPARGDLLGSSSSPSTARSTIVVTPNTDYVTVKRGDIVKFIAADKEFTWDFNGPDTVSSFELNRVAPPGLLDHKVVAYVDSNPLSLYGNGAR
jgi:hypothetical protein